MLKTGTLFNYYFQCYHAVKMLKNPAHYRYIFLCIFFLNYEKFTSQYPNPDKPEKLKVI